MWFRAVSSATPSRFAISGVSSPSASKRSTSCWRGVRSSRAEPAGTVACATGTASPKTPTTLPFWRSGAEVTLIVIRSPEPSRTSMSKIVVELPTTFRA